MLCNNNKQAQQNNDIFKRNFPDKELYIRPDYREQYKVCGNKYKDMNIVGNPVHSEKGLTPGKADPFIYFGNIDEESQLFRLNIKNTKCNTREYKPNFNDNNVIVNKPIILDNPHNEINKYYKFDDRVPNYPVNCPTNNEKFDGIKFSNLDVKSKTCLNGFDNTNELHKIRHPVPLQYKYEIDNLVKNFNREFLKVGPTRTNHTVERLWNNNTKLKVNPIMAEIPKKFDKIKCINESNKKSINYCQ